MKLKYTLLIFSIYSMSSMYFSCTKIDSFLDKKGKLSDVRPSTLKDFQAILNNTSIMNLQYPGIGLLGTDNYYLTTSLFNSLDQVDRYAYLWNKDVFSDNESGDWETSYQRIEYCNIVLDGLKKIKRNVNNGQEYDEIRGQALFFRAYTYYTLSQIFCKPYSKKSANDDLGLILRQSSDINEASMRSSVADTYKSIIDDLKECMELLPNSSNFKTQPTKVAASAALSKVYLSMSDYSNAFEKASECLKGINTLIDFNDTTLINYSSTYRFPQFQQNEEVIWYAEVGGYEPVWNFPFSVGIVDSNLYRSYQDDDLRKRLFFSDNGNGDIKNRGCYTSDGYNFSGIAVNEILLIKAECEARLDMVQESLADLNKLLKNRYITGSYNKITETDKDKLLKIVLKERRKELPFTGQLRWEDLRRLNKEPDLADTLVRIIDNKVYKLLPNSLGYVFPIPYDEIELSGIQQNER